MLPDPPISKTSSYVIALIVYQLGLAFTGGTQIAGLIVAVVLLGLL